MARNVRIVETGEYFRSAADAARVLNVSVGAVVHCLKGRRKTVAGCRVVYDMVPLGFPRTPRKRRIVYDAAGNWYFGYKELAEAKGVTPAKARSNVLKNGIYKEEPARYHCDLFGPIG